MIAHDHQALTAPAAMADETTPLIRDAWYVACFSHELVAGETLARKIAGERMFLYRRTDGTPVGLRDRCAHRSFPLAKGFVDGDDIVCGYHGFRYASDGECTAVPSQETAPRGIAVRTYAVVEAPPLVWVWAGDPSRARTEDVPSRPWLNERSGWEIVTGYLTINASTTVRLNPE